MRLAMLGPYPRDEANIIGGVEAASIYLLRHLSAFPELELHMLTCQPWVSRYEAQVRPASDAFQAAGSWIVHYVPQKRWGRFMFHLRERRRMVAVLRALRPDIVHAQASGLYAATALDSGLPAVITVHGVKFREAKIARQEAGLLRGILDTLFERSNIRRARYLIVNNPYVSREFPQITRAKTYTIDNPVEERFFQVRAEAEPGRILLPGRLIPRKAVHHLLYAFDAIAQEFPQAQLYLAGEDQSSPAYVAFLRRYVAERGLTDRVHFLGSLTIDQMAAEYGRCAFAVLPSQQETAPVAIEEAMAVGRPVIATRVGGVEYMIEHERTGLLLEYGDVPTLTAHLRRLLGDDALRERMSRAAKETALRRFRGDLVAQRTYEVYREILAESRAQADDGR